MSVIPASRQPVTEKGPSGDLLFSRTWYLFLQNLADSRADSLPIVPTGSPFVYTARNGGILIVTGGTVSLIEYGRNSLYTTTGLTTGIVPLVDGDTVRITYTVAPTITWVRR